MEKYKKVYAILHNSYRFDDLTYGELLPSFMSLDDKIVVEEFNRIKESEIKNFNNNSICERNEKRFTHFCCS